MSSDISYQHSMASSVPGPKKIKLRITPSSTPRPIRPTAPVKDGQGRPSSSGTSSRSPLMMGTSPLSPLPDEAAGTSRAGGGCHAQGIIREPRPVQAGLLLVDQRNTPSAGDSSQQTFTIKGTRGADEDKENQHLSQHLNPNPSYHANPNPNPNPHVDPNLKRSKHVRPGRPTALEKELSRLSSFTFANPPLTPSTAGRNQNKIKDGVERGHGKELRPKEKSPDRRRSTRENTGNGSSKRQRMGRMGSQRERERTLTGRRERDLHLPRPRTVSERTTDDNEARKETAVSVSSHAGSRKEADHLSGHNHVPMTDLRSSLGLEDVEAALTIQYLARDAELGRSHPTDTQQKTETPDRCVAGIDFGACGDDAMEVDKLRGGWGLGKGECSNCRVDETQAVFWWTDPVVKTELGLNRRLCHACGIFKYDNLVDRPVPVTPRKLEKLSVPTFVEQPTIQIQPLPNNFPCTPLRTAVPWHPNKLYADMKDTPGTGALISEIYDQSDWVYLFPSPSYGVPVRPYSGYKVQGGWPQQEFVGGGNGRTPEVQHISWRSP